MRRGSKLQYVIDGRQMEAPFGKVEGIGVYLNGTDLPAAVYRNSDINVVVDEINEAVAGHGGIGGHWQGPTETALYLYGDSAQEMRRLIAPFMAECPLCQRARVVDIA